jgi:hypothetical protein
VVSREKPCKVCSVGDTEVSRLNRALLIIGQSPRSAAPRYAGITRRDLTNHKDICLKDAVVEGEGVSVNGPM